MSTSIALQVKPLDEAAWQAWVARGRAQDRRSREEFVTVVKCVSVVLLLATAGLWSYFAPYEVVVRFVVCAAAMLVMFQAFRKRRYAVAVVFAALAVVYNPVVPVLRLSSEEQRVAVAAIAVPFVASFAWGNTKRDDDE